jgi:hypothetical protein
MMHQNDLPHFLKLIGFEQNQDGDWLFEGDKDVMFCSKKVNGVLNYWLIFTKYSGVVIEIEFESKDKLITDMKELISIDVFAV